MGTFKTDFGVEFGHFICFDIAFGAPANELIKRGITNFAFPTMWFSEIPFLSGNCRKYIFPDLVGVHFGLTTLNHFQPCKCNKVGRMRIM